MQGWAGPPNPALEPSADARHCYQGCPITLIQNWKPPRNSFKPLLPSTIWNLPRSNDSVAV